MGKLLLKAGPRNGATRREEQGGHSGGKLRNANIVLGSQFRIGNGIVKILRPHPLRLA